MELPTSRVSNERLTVSHKMYFLKKTRQLFLDYHYIYWCNPGTVCRSFQWKPKTTAITVQQQQMTLENMLVTTMSAFAYGNMLDFETSFFFQLIIL
jgi:hypothetical protein